MRPVVISVEHPPPRGGVVEHVFETSPVQVGRNPKADLRLAYDFVSSWHALIRFDETSASYFDLGSTNGTEVDGRRIGPGEVLEFDGPVRVRIADLTLTLSRAGTTAKMEPPLTATEKNYLPGMEPRPEPSYMPFPRSTTEKSFVPVMPVMGPPDAGLGPPERARVPSDHAFLPSAPPPERARVPSDHAFLPGPPPPSPERTRVPSDHAFLPGVAPTPGAAAPPPRPAATPMPTKMITPRRARPSATPAVSSPAELALIRELSQRLLPSSPPPQTADEARELLERVATLVETCARGVVEMQAGQERMGQELGVQTVKHYTGLRFAASASAAIEYLLADLGDSRRLDELAMGFADSMSHQVAMLDGLVAGARALMDAVEPRAIEVEVGAGRIGRFRELWSTYSAHWQRLAADDRKLVKALFGPEFARVYAEVGGELSAGWRRDEGGDGSSDGEGSKRAP